ncbi:uncharacterized protein LACBIDRAFT_331197 [Laccaria bicolor S238N-H82]|uniref:Predicted protein n=1 Tax=Laccaria bicolor (strain S238N-H82 / ATCC MYA-4686) TaxID=486041 RepID=B0DNR8_LACBS|nr:uncharacterized protein LACBIDRAFT_331197 [Laccaria bicolor S238N-H82]EDR03773.1 predicted protein [Laccaria bicolor S238N-H82]|eukprot:XP_001885626.1 predicted protein [Laccaria bicolor S238N-H82]
MFKYVCNCAPKAKLVRKLGYGLRSSVWLVWDGEDHLAVKIYTIAASEHAKTVGLPILKVVHDLDMTLNLPAYHGKFLEKTTARSHLCVVSNPMSTTVRALQHDANYDLECLPVHIVQRIVRTVADDLRGLHSVGIVHGAIKPENIYFWTLTPTEYLLLIFDSEPAPAIRKIEKYLTVISQPLFHRYKRTAQQSNYEPEKEGDYSLAPETLLQTASCSPQTDIWMPGYMAKQLHLSGVLGESIDSIPPSWLSDAKMKDYHAVTSGISYDSTVEASRMSCAMTMWLVQQRSSKPVFAWTRKSGFSNGGV